jgi:hypothetical protein
MTDRNELEDLDALVQSPGWLRVLTLFEAQWGRSGQRYCDVLEKMANSTDRMAVADDLQRVIWVRKELELFMRGVEARVAELRNKSASQGVGSSRRGVL